MFSTDRRGFTLVELLIAVLIAGLFAIAMFNFVSSQARFTKVQSAREEVDQNLRGALEILASELRSVPGGGILRADSNAMSFLLPRVWGMYCGYEVGAQKHHIVFPAGTAANNYDAIPTDFVPGTGNRWMLVVDSTTSGSGMYESAIITDSATVTTGTCVTAGVPLTGQAVNPVGVRFGVSPAALPVLPATGNGAYIGQPVKYDKASATLGGRTAVWLRRNMGNDTVSMQQLAGPLATTAATPALRFDYYCGTTAVATGTPALNSKITSVRVILTVQSRPSTQSVLQTTADTLTVHLRNSGRVTC
jgi:prepilin-type N-terminal cleavage/methylation domain-containing protein